MGVGLGIDIGKALDEGAGVIDGAAVGRCVVFIAEIYQNEN